MQAPPAPSAPPLPGSLVSGHVVDGARHTQDLPPASQDVSCGLLQHHQQALDQDVIQKDEQNQELCKAAYQEAEDVKKASSSLGKCPQPPTPGCRLYRSAPEQTVLAATANLPSDDCNITAMLR